jgi:co-chaperonin GroES (HSP10)
MNCLNCGKAEASPVNFCCCPQCNEEYQVKREKVLYGEGPRRVGKYLSVRDVNCGKRVLIDPTSAIFEVKQGGNVLISATRGKTTYQSEVEVTLTRLEEVLAEF